MEHLDLLGASLRRILSETAFIYPVSQTGNVAYFPPIYREVKQSVLGVPHLALFADDAAHTNTFRGESATSAFTILTPSS
jgi:hypothetical protein